MIEIAGWIAPAATMIAASMTAANLGSRVTGWGFVVFTAGAVAWIVVAFASGQTNLLLTNLFLLLVDVVGIWRWLGREARYDAAATAATARSTASPAPTLFALGSLAGRSVQDADGAAIASTVEAMADCTSGAIAYLVVREGGVAGVGERLHALGWDEVALRDGVVHARIPRATLAARLALDAAHWPESREAAGVA